MGKSFRKNDRYAGKYYNCLPKDKKKKLEKRNNHLDKPKPMGYDDPHDGESNEMTEII
jgi:hypothetical protein